MSEERVKVTLDVALARIGPGLKVHTFVQSGAVLLGADWSRKQIIKAILQYGIEESGLSATRMGHGLVILEPTRAVFIATEGTP